MTGNSVASEKYWAMAQIGDRSKKENVNLGRMHLEFLEWRKIPETLIQKIVALPALPYTGLHVDFDPEAAWLTLASNAWGKEGNPLLFWGETFVKILRHLALAPKTRIGGG